MTDYDLALATRAGPAVRPAEPFLPSRVGFDVFRAPADFPGGLPPDAGQRRRIDFDLPGLAAVVEYGIWWDWDIQHLYELEAAWVYLDGHGDVLRVDASWHGSFHEMRVGDAPPLRGPRPLLLLPAGQARAGAEPGVVHPASASSSPAATGPA